MVEEGMLVKFPLVPFATCLLHMQLLLQGSFHQDKVKQKHCRNTQRSKIMNFSGLLRHQITCHSPPFPVCQNSVNTVEGIGPMTSGNPRFREGAKSSDFNREDKRNRKFNLLSYKIRGFLFEKY